MVLQASEQAVAIDGLSVLSLENPTRHLLVPNQDMPVDLHVILLAEVDEGVGCFETKLPFDGLQSTPLEHVLGRDAVELSRRQLAAFGVGREENTLVDGNSDFEVVLVGLCQRAVAHVTGGFRAHDLAAGSV